MLSHIHATSYVDALSCHEPSFIGSKKNDNISNIFCSFDPAKWSLINVRLKYVTRGGAKQISLPFNLTILHSCLNEARTNSVNPYSIPSMLSSKRLGPMCTLTNLTPSTGSGATSPTGCCSIHRRQPSLSKAQSSKTKRIKTEIQFWLLLVSRELSQKWCSNLN